MINVYLTTIKEITKCEGENTVHLITLAHIETPDGNNVDESADKFIFATNSSLIIQANTNVPATVTENLSTMELDREAFCDSASLKCPGELFPYDNLQHCYDTLAYIPTKCEAGVKDDYTDGILQGDTMACRLLHLLSAGLRPVIHCPHLANISVVCVPQECESATRLEIPTEVSETFYGGHRAWIRIIEIIILGLVISAIFGAYIWYIRVRNQFRNVLDGQSARFESLIENSVHQIPRPYLQFCDLAMSWKEMNTNNAGQTIFHEEQGYLGYCQMTCLTGESGSGKTSFIKALCGYEVGHINLHCGQWLRRDPIAFCPQSVDMWPKEMIVRDILLFACVMNNVDSKQYTDSFETLGLNETMDQEFATLSCGQQHRVSIAASIIRSEPTLIFLDGKYDMKV